MKILTLKPKEPDEPHLSGDAFCVTCGHRWAATAPVGTIQLECPSCHAMRGVFKYPCEPEVAWTCGCGCFIFMISGKENILCYNCGEIQVFPAPVSR